MSYNIKPNFKAIRYFERMTGISFIEVEKHPEYIVNLIYCCLLVHPENNFRMTFEDAAKSFFPRHINELIKDFTTESLIAAQFTKEILSHDSSVNQEHPSSPKEEETVYMSSLIPLLITNCHLDANFVLNDMDYTDTKMFFESSVEQQHEEMEDKRFWTYLTVAPHLSSKSNVKGPTDLIEFSWEKGKRKKEAEEKMKRDRQKLIEKGIIKEDDLNKEQES